MIDLCDMFSGNTFVRHLRMVLTTGLIRRALYRMSPEPPTALNMAINMMNSSHNPTNNDKLCYIACNPRPGIVKAVVRRAQSKEVCYPPNEIVFHYALPGYS